MPFCERAVHPDARQPMLLSGLAIERVMVSCPSLLPVCSRGSAPDLKMDRRVGRTNDGKASQAQGSKVLEVQIGQWLAGRLGSATLSARTVRQEELLTLWKAKVYKEMEKTLRQISEQTGSLRDDFRTTLFASVLSPPAGSTSAQFIIHD